MSMHNISFYGELMKIILHLSSNDSNKLLSCSTVTRNKGTGLFIELGKITCSPDVCDILGMWDVGLNKIKKKKQERNLRKV